VEDLEAMKNVIEFFASNAKDFNYMKFVAASEE
jgi:hypothetical protein